VQDLDGDRYTDDRIIRAINLGLLDLRRVRPDYYIGMYDTPTYQAVSLDETYPLNEQSFPAIVKYATGWVETADDEYVENSRAALLLAQFNIDTEGKRNV
jgi:hypothetical protein